VYNAGSGSIRAAIPPAGADWEQDQIDADIKSLAGGEGWPPEGWDICRYAFDGVEGDTGIPRKSDDEVAAYFSSADAYFKGLSDSLRDARTGNDLSGYKELGRVYKYPRTLPWVGADLTSVDLAGYDTLIADVIPPKPSDQIIWDDKWDGEMALQLPAGFNGKVVLNIYPFSDTQTFSLHGDNSHWTAKGYNTVPQERPYSFAAADVDYKRLLKQKPWEGAPADGSYYVTVDGEEIVDDFTGLIPEYNWDGTTVIGYGAYFAYTGPSWDKTFDMSAPVDISGYDAFTDWSGTRYGHYYNASGQITDGPGSETVPVKTGGAVTNTANADYAASRVIYNFVFVPGEHEPSVNKGVTLFDSFNTLVQGGILAPYSDFTGAGGGGAAEAVLVCNNFTTDDTSGSFEHHTRAPVWRETAQILRVVSAAARVTTSEATAPSSVGGTTAASEPPTLPPSANSSAPAVIPAVTTEGTVTTEPDTDAGTSAAETTAATEGTAATAPGEPDDPVAPPYVTQPPPYVPGTPGGDNFEIPPVPMAANGRVALGEDGTYLELDENGTPLGAWRWDDGEARWIFDELPLAGVRANPRTGNNTPVSAAGALIALGGLAAAKITARRSGKGEK
jgi:hypothetical protein